MILSSGNTLEEGGWLPVAKFTAPNGKAYMQKPEDVEKGHIVEIVKKTNRKGSGEKGPAKIPGINPTTPEARMKKLGIKRDA